MKYFVSLLTLGALAHAATPVMPRQASSSGTIRQIVQGVIDDANALNQAVQAFSSQADIDSVQSAIDKLQGDISSGASQFTSLTPVSFNEAGQLANLVQPLTGATSDAVNTVVGKKDTIVANCGGVIAYNTFNDLIPAAQTFADNLKALIPTELQSVIDGASSTIQSSLQSGLSAYQDSQSLPPSCGGTSPPGETTTTTPPPGGSTTTPPPGGYPTDSTSYTTPTSTTSSLPGYTTTTKGPIATYTGAAVPAAMANFGAIALAVAAAAL